MAEKGSPPETTVGMRIGQLARQAGVALRTLRYYEELGLIQPVRRRPGGFRYYDETALQRLERIRQLKELLGFTLEEVRRILESENAVAELRAVFQHRRCGRAPEDHPRGHGRDRDAGGHRFWASSSAWPPLWRSCRNGSLATAS